MLRKIYKSLKSSLIRLFLSCWQILKVWRFYKNIQYFLLELAVQNMSKPLAIHNLASMIIKVLYHAQKAEI